MSNTKSYGCVKIQDLWDSSELKKEEDLSSEYKSKTTKQQTKWMGKKNDEVQDCPKGTIKLISSISWAMEFLNLSQIQQQLKLKLAFDLLLLMASFLRFLQRNPFFLFTSTCESLQNGSTSSYCKIVEEVWTCFHTNWLFSLVFVILKVQRRVESVRKWDKPICIQMDFFCWLGDIEWRLARDLSSERAE